MVYNKSFFVIPAEVGIQGYLPLNPPIKILYHILRDLSSLFLKASPISRRWTC